MEPFRKGVARALVLAAIGLGILVAAPEPARAGADTTLRFLRDGREVARLDLAALASACRARTITVDPDPYYGRPMTFRAFALAEVLALGFGTRLADAERETFFLRARDGYVKPASPTRLAEAGAYLAFTDAARGTDAAPGWEPIDRRQVDPGPYYLVWTEPAQRDVHRYPWPYQLAAIEIASFAGAYPHTVPRGEPAGGAAWAGFEIFRGECIACHAVNGEGGKVGPDLNVPRSIVEYRPAAQIKAYVRDPTTFRYTSMPSHPHLTDADLEALLAYFRAMQTRKHDPGRAP